MRLGDVVRTARVAGAFLGPMALELVRGRASVDSTTAAGLASIRGRLERLLAQIGVDVEVRHRDLASSSTSLLVLQNHHSPVQIWVAPPKFQPLAAASSAGASNSPFRDPSVTS